MSMSKTASAAMMFLLLSLLLSGCGRKGPLYMQATPVKPAPFASAPLEQKPVSPDLSIQSQPAQTQTEPQK